MMRRGVKSISGIALTLALMSLTTLYGYFQEPESLQGIWMNEQGTRKAEIYAENNRFFGKLLWVADNSRVKEGDIIFRDLVWNGVVFTGKAETPRGSALCTIAFESESRIRITGSKGGMSKSVYWTRVK